MIRHREGVVVERPLAEVFAFVCDFEHVPEWESTVDSVVVRTEGPTRVGTAGTQVRRIAGLHMEAPFEVVGFDPAGSMAVRSKAGPVEVVGRFTCRPLVGATEVTVEIELRLGLAMRLAEPVLRHAVVHEARENLRRLKRALEAR